MNGGRLGLVLIVISASPIAVLASDQDQSLGDWLSTNEPRVVAFVGNLTKKSVGSTVRGVRLTDGTKVLAGYKYLGEVRDAGPGAHVHLFALGHKRVAYIWVDHSGPPLPLPECRLKPTEDESANVLSGDVYTFREVQPGDLVIFNCPRPEAWQAWMPTSSPARSMKKLPTHRPTTDHSSGSNSALPHRAAV